MDELMQDTKRTVSSTYSLLELFSLLLLYQEANQVRKAYFLPNDAVSVHLYRGQTTRTDHIQEEQARLGPSDGV